MVAAATDRGIVVLDRLEQTDIADLDEILQRLGAVAVMPGAGPHER